MRFSPEGKVITAEDMVLINERQESKARYLADARADREAQLGQRHSHVGVEIGLDLKDMDLIAHVYSAFADLANYCALNGRDGAGRLMQSLAIGLSRSAVNIFGREAETQLLGLPPMPTRTQLLKPLGMVDDRTAENIAREIRLAELNLPPSEAEESETVDISKAVGNIYLDDGGDDVPFTNGRTPDPNAEDEPEFTTLTPPPGQDDVARQILIQAGFDPDDPNAPRVQYQGTGLTATDPVESGEDIADSISESVSPEPDTDNPTFQRAAERRAAKLAAQQTKTLRKDKA